MINYTWPSYAVIKCALFSQKVYKVYGSALVNWFTWGVRNGKTGFERI